MYLTNVPGDDVMVGDLITNIVFPEMRIPMSYRIWRNRNQVPLLVTKTRDGVLHFVDVLGERWSGLPYEDAGAFTTFDLFRRGV